MRDIAKWADKTNVLSRLLRMAGLCLIAASLPGCMGAGLDLASGAQVDKTVATGSIPATANGTSLADATTVQNAVTSADVAKIGGNPIPWANASSGSAGVISSITEVTVDGTLCRRFVTTRHSYQGIAKFDGNTCLMDDGRWTLTSFGPRG